MSLLCIDNFMFQQWHAAISSYAKVIHQNIVFIINEIGVQFGKLKLILVSIIYQCYTVRNTIAFIHWHCQLIQFMIVYHCYINSSEWKIDVAKMKIRKTHNHKSPLLWNSSAIIISVLLISVTTEIFARRPPSIRIGKLNLLF